MKGATKIEKQANMQEIVIAPSVLGSVSSRNGWPRVDILNVPINVLTREQLTGALRHVLETGQRGWFSYVNIHAINLSLDLHWFRQFLQHSLVTYCDGAGVRVGAWMLGKKLPERIVMTDWIHDVCDLAQRLEKRVFFLGSTRTIIAWAVNVLGRMYPGMIIAGFHHGYFSREEQERIVHHINDSRPDILVVGMGMPLQERWILENIEKLDVPVLLNAGSCFDFVAGAKSRCPRWMGQAGMEWLFRLLLEPRRLWRRYLIGNPRFMLRVLFSRFLA